MLNCKSNSVDTMWILTLTSCAVLITVCSVTTEDDFDFLLLLLWRNNTWTRSTIPEHDIDEDPDEWPHGSYTLLMSKYGCPRGEWNRGYIDLTWRTPHIMITHTTDHQCDNYNITTDKYLNNTECRPLLSERLKPTSHSTMFGPFSKYKTTLNFCQRLDNRSEELSNATNSWPEGNFRLFDANPGCPSGFTHENRTIILPSDIEWNAIGFLPQFNVEVDTVNTRTILTLGECVRDKLNDFSETSSILTTSNSAFIILKDGDNPCPTNQGSKMISESISLTSMESAMPDVTHMFQFCYYQPGQRADQTGPRNKGYEIRRIGVRYGGPEELQDAIQYDDQKYTMFCSENSTCWVLFDIGRALLVKSVRLPGVIQYTCQAGNDKWLLLRYGGVPIDGVSQPFIGRYIIVLVPKSKWTNDYFDMFITVEYTNMMCLSDLGMADGGITMDQITTSNKSSIDNSVRAYNSGWCADIDDPDPYVQVDLLEETLLDGITVHNWYKTEINIINGSYIKRNIPMGTRSFTIEFSSDGAVPTPNRNLSFHMDQFRPPEESQTFLFYNQLLARYVKILLTEPMTNGMYCIKFELHGCRPNGIIDRQSLLYWYLFDSFYALTGATQVLTSASQFTSVGFPSPTRDGTSYIWIVDFRKLGHIKLIFKEISLQNYQDRSFRELWYHCRDDFRILAFSSKMQKWTVPTSKKHKNMIIETKENYLHLEFLSCRPFLPRQNAGSSFIAYVEKYDTPICGDILKKDNDCQRSSMILSTMSLVNIPSDDYLTSWSIQLAKCQIRITIQYFNILCSTGTLFIVEDPFSTKISYTNCNKPSTLLSESERLFITYKIGQNKTSMMEGFRAIYSAVDIDHQQVVDTIGHDFHGLRRFEYVDGSSGQDTNDTIFLVYKACSKKFMKCYNLFTGKPTSWRIANEQCLARRKKLVTMRSPEELFMVKYMLRTFRNVKVDDGSITSVFSTDVVDPNYFLHIGMSRKSGGQFLWLDGSPPSYTFWNETQPTIYGDCVRMSFHLGNKNNTWENEDCTLQYALFFICEEPVETLPLSDLATQNPKTYIGKMNTTRNGRSCQRWDSLTPHAHEFDNFENFPDGNSTAAENFCRDPGDEGYLWCFTTDPEVRREACPVKTEINDWNPSEYTGRLSTTISGRTCQRWDTMSPHHHDRNYDKLFPHKTVSDAANFCRDPGAEKGSLWCYTTDPNIRWDFCKMIDTVIDRCHRTHNPYNVTLSETYSGLACQKWDSLGPLGENKANVENNCRDPYDEGFLWCFTTDPDVKREVCSVQDIGISANKMSPNELYTCTDGKQISAKKRCNGIVDCFDALDELKCDYQVQNLLQNQTAPDESLTLTQTQFLCESNEIISFLARCDGIVDCFDGTDERDCIRGTAECSKDEFQCGDGSCIHASLVCDFINHCTDYTDEQCDHRGCKHDEFRCNNGQCIPMAKRCDAYENCFDRSDEHTCDSCGNQAFHCDITECIPKKLVCDGFPDCRDDYDEKACTDTQYPSCEDRWLSNIIAECNFDNVDIDGSVSTIFHARGYYHANVYKVALNHAALSDLKLFLDNADYECEQTFIQRCTPAVQTVAEVEDPNFENEYKHCRCVALTVSPLDFKNKTVVHACNNKTQVLKDTAIEVNYYEINQIAYLSRASSEDIEITFGPITCRNDVFLNPKSRMYKGRLNTTVYGIPCQRWDEQYPHSHNYTDPKWFPENTVESAENFCRDPSRSGYTWCYTNDSHILWQNCSSSDDNMMLPCEEPGITYPADVKCIYDTDNAGYIIGCRSGSHLQDCSDFVCPKGSVKCPGSYCIPLHYVCDGVYQCPGNEDEQGCGCSNGALEVILLVSIEEFRDNDLTVRQIANQFHHRGAIVRLLYFSVHVHNDLSPPHYKVLKITDTEIKQDYEIIREHDCTYQLPASEFFDRIRLSNATTRGIIFIQNGEESQSVAHSLFQNLHQPGYDVYRLINGAAGVGTKVEEYERVTDITVRDFGFLPFVGSNIFSSLCKDSSRTLCQGHYKCSSSKKCIELTDVCDGYVHCPFHDDEMFCDFTCPPSCSCSGFDAYCNSAAFENSTDFGHIIDTRLRVLDLSTNIHIGDLINSNEGLVLDFPFMIMLNLSECNIVRMRTNYFQGLSNLRYLDLSHNKISKIPYHAFYGLTKLVSLNLKGNDGLMTYDQYAFYGLASLRDLEITDMDIQTISSKTFSGLELDTLQLSRNNILDISDDALSGLTVTQIIFESNSITSFDGSLFNGISELKSLKTSAYKYCCIRPDYLPEASCLPERDEFSSCEDLMRNSALQTMLWLMGTCALLGNIFAIIYRVIYDRERLKLGYGIFVTNLAVADLIMGIYLLIIAIADASFRNRYIYMDENWRKSSWCTFAGVLSTLSSESGVLFICLITFDRFLAIKYPFSRLRFTTATACIASIAAWILSISISVTPLLAQEYFQNNFYSKSGVCVALPLTRDRPPGWLYSVIIFIGFNFVTFICIAYGQLLIYLEIRNTSSTMIGNTSESMKARRRNELIVARNLLLVVGTDFLCWFPIGCMGIIAMSGHVVPGVVYVWVAVFVLPVNSALNPILYTLTAILGKRKREGAKGLDGSLNTSSNFTAIPLKTKKTIGNEKLISYFLQKEEKYSTTMVSVEDIIQQNLGMTSITLLKFTLQMTDCLRLLHKTSMVLETLTTNKIVVSVGHGKITGDVQIREQPKRGTSPESKSDNMYKLGVIIRRLMCNSVQKLA